MKVKYCGKSILGIFTPFNVPSLTNNKTYDVVLDNRNGGCVVVIDDAGRKSVIMDSDYQTLSEEE